MIYLAFHNNADLQAEVLAEVRQHVAAGLDAYEAATKKQAARLIQFLKAA